MNQQTLERCEHQLERYVAGKLGPHDEAEVEAHVEVCAECRKGLDVLLAAAEGDRWLHRLGRVRAEDVADVKFLEPIIRDHSPTVSLPEVNAGRLRPHLIRCIATCAGSMLAMIGVGAALFFGPALSAGPTKLLAFLLVTSVLLFFAGLVSFVAPVLELLVMQKILLLKQNRLAGELVGLKETMRANDKRGQISITGSQYTELKALLSHDVEAGA